MDPKALRQYYTDCTVVGVSPDMFRLRYGADNLVHLRLVMKKIVAIGADFVLPANASVAVESYAHSAHGGKHWVELVFRSASSDPLRKMTPSDISDIVGILSDRGAIHLATKVDMRTRVARLHSSGRTP